MTKIASVLRLIEPSTFFAFVALVFGAVLILVTPPLQGPDEQAHFVQAYRVSEGKIGPALASPAKDELLPASLTQTYKLLFYGPNDIRFDGNRKYSLGETKQALNIPLDQGHKIKSSYMSGTGYSAVSYVPQSIMIALGRLFNAPPIVLIYLGRVGGLLAWVAITYLAIRLIPIAKWGTVVVALIPMSLFQASVLSADTIPLALLGLYIALLLHFGQASRPITTRHLALLAAIGSLMALGKQIMVIFVPLIFLLAFKGGEPKNTRQPKLLLLGKLVGVVFASIVIAAGWTVIAGASGGTSTGMEGQNLNPPVQIHHLMTHPTEFLFALWNTNFYSWGDNVTRSLIGTFGWADTPMALSFTIAGFFMLFVILLSNRGRDYELLPWIAKKGARLGMLLLLAAFFLATSLAMYIYYSPVDFNIIVGLQGRYFLPLLPALLLLTINKDQLVLKPGAYVFFSRVMPVAMLTISCVYITIRYYLPTLI